MLHRAPSHGPILALTGRAGCGKSTAAAYLADRHGFARVRFAGPLKAMLRAFLSTTGAPEAEIERMIEGDLKEVPSPLLGGKSPRFAMQRLGTEWGRDLLNPSLWVDAWQAGALAALRAGAPGVVAEDCRFPNEATGVWTLGGQVARIERSGVAATPGDHVSEAGLKGDWGIRNDGPPEILHARLDGIVRRLARAA